MPVGRYFLNLHLREYFLFFFLCFQLCGAQSFDLFSKQIYWIDGPNVSNFDGEAGDPGSRMGAASWFDLSGNLWMFGGNSPDGSRNDLWQYRSFTWFWMGGTRTVNDPGVYKTLNETGTPANRYGAATWVDASTGNLWLHGGLSVISQVLGTAPLDDLWVYNITNATWTWVSGDLPQSPVPVTTDIPSARSSASSWVTGNSLYLFGGLEDVNTTNDLWKFDIPAQNWTLVEASRPGFYATSGGYPPPRAGAALWVDSFGNVWLFGGKAATGSYLSDLWKYTPSLGVWSWMTSSNTVNDPGTYPATTGASGGSPSSRAQACSWLDNEGSLWLYGGSRVNVNGTKVYSGDFWKRSTSSTTTSWIWAGTSPATPEFPLSLNGTGAPGGRSWSTCWIDTEGNMFFYGGQNLQGSWDDVWVLDMNECATNNGGCSTTCVNQLAAPYTCTPCPPGTQGDPYIEPCADINECLTNNGGCDPLTNCTNNIGAPPNCSACPPGYNGTGSTGCVYFDVCTVNNGGCDPRTNCTPNALPNMPPTCGPCPWGFNGTGNTSCVDINECLTNNGGCDALTNCTNNIGAPPTCGPCPPYYNGTGATGCKDINECLTNNGGCDPLTNCTNNIGAPPTCSSCPLYYVGTGNTACTDLDECATLNGGCPAQSVCTNNIGAPPTCGPCINGFIGNNFCSGRENHSPKSAGMIAGITIGGFIVLLALIALIFYLTKDHTQRKKQRKNKFPPAQSSTNFELTALSLS